MKKIVLSLILGVTLVGCGGTESQELEQQTTPSGRNFSIAIRDEVERSYTPVAVSNASSSEPGTVSAFSCWVTLEWCSAPGSGEPECSGTSGCTIQRTIDACGSLIEDHC
jgi:hypothetical protein